jgi:tetratricopeptide (TPR) repeat protein
LWVLGYPEAALRDADDAINFARELRDIGGLMGALKHAVAYTLSGKYAEAAAHAQELVNLAEEKKALFWNAEGRGNQGILLTLAGRASDAIKVTTSAIAASRSTGGTLWTPFRLQYLARAYADLGQFGDAWRCIGEAIIAIETAKEKWCEAEVHRTAAEIALKPAESDAAKAQACFERALSVARAQQAKSWELRTSMSLARLWQSQGKSGEAYELLAPVYNWFTEGFDTADLKEAKALLAELGS